MPTNPNAISNHVVDPETGFLESNGFPDAFNATKKNLFLAALKSNGFDLGITCESLSISKHTFHKHIDLDPVFKREVNHALDEYARTLEWVSRAEALKPKNTLERFFQLKALYPSKYAREENSRSQPIVHITLDSSKLSHEKSRVLTVDAEVVTEMDTPQLKSVDHQSTAVTKHLT